MEQSILNKFFKLKHLLRQLDSCLIAFSGGIDSSFLLAVAKNILGKDKVIAEVIISELLKEKEKKYLLKIIPSKQIIKFSFLKLPFFIKNPPNRCYYCKKKMFSILRKIAEQKKIKYILDGSHSDDFRKDRAGIKALKELGIRSPLQEVGLTKKEIRELAKYIGLKIWDKPAESCLATRVLTNQIITLEKLNQIEQIENFLTSLKFSNYRLRHCQEIIKIEFLKTEFIKVKAKKEIIEKYIKNLNFQKVELQIFPEL